MVDQFKYFGGRQDLLIDRQGKEKRKIMNDPSILGSVTC